MPVPRINSDKYKLSKDELKMRRKAALIVNALCEMGYDVGNEREAVQIIEKDNLDKFQFDYPYGSYDLFKKHVLNGEFDVSIHIGSKKEHDEFMKPVIEGEAWIIS